MTNKLYDKTKTFIKENYKSLVIFIVIILLMTFKLPYYISAPGGLINTSSRVDMTTDFKMEGSLNMAYVTEFEGIIPMLLKKVSILFLFSKEIIFFKSSSLNE